MMTPRGEIPDPPSDPVEREAWKITFHSYRYGSTPRTLEQSLTEKRMTPKPSLPPFLWLVLAVAIGAIILDKLAWGNSGAWILGVLAVLAIVGWWAWNKFIFKGGDE